MSKTLPTDHAWAAGVIDGEGSIQIKRNGRGYCLVVTVGQSARADVPPMITRLHDLYGGSFYKDSGQRVRDGHKPCWQWYIASAQAETCLRHVRPYLIQKCDQADVALAYREQGMGRGNGLVAAAFVTELRAVRA